MIPPFGGFVLLFIYMDIQDILIKKLKFYVLFLYLTGLFLIGTIFFGIIIGSFFRTVFDTFVDVAFAAQLPSLEVEQSDYYKKNKEYFTDVSNPDFEIHTYETICKGYYTIDKTDKKKVVYTGYGDLDFKYTYEEFIDFSSATSTKL